MKRDWFYIYGEGSVLHRDGCSEASRFHFHPQIQRAAWSSRRAYIKAESFRWLFSRLLPYWAPPQPGGGNQRVTGWAGWIAARAFPDVPMLWTQIAIADSIYDRDE
jgi:hypothetical protein